MAGRAPGGSAVRDVGRVVGANGNVVTVVVDCDAVIISAGRAILGPAERDQFARLYMEAERQAEEWAKEHGTDA